jgi:hypothetical protein
MTASLSRQLRLPRLHQPLHQNHRQRLVQAKSNRPLPRGLLSLKFVSQGTVALCMAAKTRAGACLYGKRQTMLFSATIEMGPTEVPAFRLWAESHEEAPYVCKSRFSGSLIREPKQKQIPCTWGSPFLPCCLGSTPKYSQGISKYVCLKQVFNFAVRALHHFYLHTIGKTAPISLLEAICAVSER